MNVYLFSMPHQRPAADTFNTLAGWRCPLCNHTGYMQVAVARPNGGSYMTEFYECSGCTVMFRHPGRFARLGAPVRRWALDVEPRTLREVHGFISESAVPPEDKGD